MCAFLLQKFVVSAFWDYKIWKCALDPENSTPTSSLTVSTIPLFFSEFFSILLLLFFWESAHFHIWKYAFGPWKQWASHVQQWANRGQQWAPRLAPGSPAMSPILTRCRLEPSLRWVQFTMLSTRGWTERTLMDESGLGQNEAGNWTHGDWYGLTVK